MLGGFIACSCDDALSRYATIFLRACSTSALVACDDESEFEIASDVFWKLRQTSCTCLVNAGDVSAAPAWKPPISPPANRPRPRLATKDTRLTARTIWTPLVFRENLTLATLAHGRCFRHASCTLWRRSAETANPDGLDERDIGSIPRESPPETGRRDPEAVPWLTVCD